MQAAVETCARLLKFQPWAPLALPGNAVRGCPCRPEIRRLIFGLSIPPDPGCRCGRLLRTRRPDVAGGGRSRRTASPALSARKAGKGFFVAIRAGRPVRAPVTTGDAAHARRTGFRPSRHASSRRGRKLRRLRPFQHFHRRRAPRAVPFLACPPAACRAGPLPELRPGFPARGRKILHRVRRAPPRQRPQGRPQTPPAAPDPGRLRGMRRQTRKAPRAALRSLQRQTPGHEPPAHAGPQGRTEAGWPLRTVRRQGTRRRQCELRRLPRRAPAGLPRPDRPPPPAGRPLALHRMRKGPSGARKPPLPGLPAAARKTRQGGRRTPPGSPPRRRFVCRLRPPSRRARSHGLRSLSCRLAGPLQPESARSGLPRALHPLCKCFARRGLDPVPALSGRAAARRASEVAPQGGRSPRPRRVRLLREAASRSRVRLLPGLP